MQQSLIDLLRQHPHGMHPTKLCGELNLSMDELLALLESLPTGTVWIGASGYVYLS